MEKAKTYHLMRGIGRIKYCVNYHTGDKFYQDGSMAMDVALFNNKRKANQFVRELHKQGYSGNGIF